MWMWAALTCARARQVRQRQRHVDVVRHQVQHALVEAAHRVPEQAAQWVSRQPSS
jgi:hypothetical protein